LTFRAIESRLRVVTSTDHNENRKQSKEKKEPAKRPCLVTVTTGDRQPGQLMPTFVVTNPPVGCPSDVPDKAYASWAFLRETPGVGLTTCCDDVAAIGSRTWDYVSGAILAMVTATAFTHLALKDLAGASRAIQIAGWAVVTIALFFVRTPRSSSR
jgi:hypothetical protein